MTTSVLGSRILERMRVEYRSLRLRWLGVMIPLALVTMGLLSLTSARLVRAVATPVILRSAETLMHSLVLHIRRAGGNRVAIRKLLEEHLVDRNNAALILLEKGKDPLIVGTPHGLERTLREAEELLAEADHGIVVHDLGPLSTWTVAARKIDDRRALVSEHRLHGPGTRYWAAAFGVVFAVIVVSLGLAFALAQVIYRPLVQRLDYLENALVGFGKGQGDLRLESGDDVKDELDGVFDAFNEMADRIVELEADRDRRIEAERALLADLAHDINTPITILRGYAETLLERDAGLEPDDRKNIHAEMIGQSLYVQAIVEDLLTMAGARNAQLLLEPDVVDLDALFDAVVDSFQPMAQHRGMAIIGDADGLRCRADPVRLRQILTNLVRNALLHADGATVIELQAEVRAGGTILSVRDDGPGVPEEIVPDLFERHRRAPGLREAGWGLGLAIVRTLAELHGGEVRYRPGNPGSVFEVWLPDDTMA